jgi:nucleoside-diphosphate-sugar epimerase
MKILFLGGTGNISSECTARLHRDGHEIQVLTRGRSAVPPEYTALRADRKDPAAMQAAVKQAKPDVALDFVGYELADVEQDYELFRKSVRQFIFISSATVYAKPPARLPITEDAPLGNAFWDYAQKKLACEQWLLGRWKEARFPVTIVRPSHTYSKHWIPNPVSSASYSFALRLKQGKPVFVPDDGENPWTLTAASDFAAGLAGLVGNAASIGEAFHITSDEALTWNQICLEIAAAVGGPSAQIVGIPTDFICEVAPQLTGNLKGDKSHPGVFDNSKLKRFVPGFRCLKPFRVGVCESAAWLDAHPEDQNLKPEVDALIESVIGAWEARGRR